VTAVLLCLACGESSRLDEIKSAGRQAFLAEDYKKARTILKEGLKDWPADRDLLYYMGMTYRHLSYYDSAIAFLKRADIMHPKDREINEQLYQVAYTVGDWDVALAALSGLVATGDPIEEHYDEYAELWARKDHPINAYYWTQKSLEVNPDNQENYLRAAQLAVITKSGPSPGEWIDSAMARFGESDRLWRTKAEVLYKSGDFEGSEAILRVQYGKDTTNLGMRLTLARVLALQDDNEKKREAVTLLETLRERMGPEFQIDSLIDSLNRAIK
jgi:tetratricopeptide (TPR) repeat protein